MHKLIALAAALGLAAPVFASTTLTFQEGVNGYAGTQDTMIRSNVSAAGSGQSGNGDSTSLNFGSLDFISVDGDDGSPGSKPNQGLIRFDNLFGNGVGQIKAGDTILSATLKLQMFDPGSGFAVHDMLIDWTENAVTWNSVTSGIQPNGVEAVSSALASFGANNSSENMAIGQLTIDVTNSLLAMQNATLSGYGWLLNPFASGTNGIDIRTSEYAVLGERPMLSVEIAPVPEVDTWAMMMCGLGLLGLRLRRKSRGTHVIKA